MICSWASYHVLGYMVGYLPSVKECGGATRIPPSIVIPVPYVVPVATEFLQTPMIPSAVSATLCGTLSLVLPS